QYIWDVLKVHIPPDEGSLSHKERFVRTFVEADDRHKKLIAISLWCLWPVIGSAVKESWRPPEFGFIKINFDASFIQDKGLATTAVLARNYKEDVVGAKTYLFKEVADSFVAEAQACERALVFAHKMGFQQLAVEGDALSFIKNIRRNEAGKSIIRPIIYNIHQLDRNFEEVKYSFVSREVNKAAHVLAIEGRRRGVCWNWVNDVPDLVRIVVRKDRLGWDQRSQGC
ncbi:hypothetical protein Golob_006850, partial [Gossypium lobatum]|nr:hypothetical protein [Gossypium lobatum]